MSFPYMLWFRRVAIFFKNIGHPRQFLPAVAPRDYRGLMDATTLTGLVGTIVGALLGIVATLIGVAANERASTRARVDRALGAILRAIYVRRQQLEADDDAPADVELLAAIREYIATAPRRHKVIANELLETRAAITSKRIVPEKALNALAARLTEWWSGELDDAAFRRALAAIRVGDDSRNV
jgi:hypothetical protein